MRSETLSDCSNCYNLQFCFMLWWRPWGRNPSSFVGMAKKLVKLRFSCYFFETLCLCCLLGSHAQITLDELDRWVQVVLNRGLVLMLMCISWRAHAPRIQNRDSFALQTTTTKKKHFHHASISSLVWAQSLSATKPQTKQLGENSCGIPRQLQAYQMPERQGWKTGQLKIQCWGCKQHDGQIPKPRILHAMQTALGWVRSNILPFEMGDVYVYLHAYFLHNGTQSKKWSHSKIRWAKKGAFQFKMCRHTSLSQNKQTNKKLKKNC